METELSPHTPARVPFRTVLISMIGLWLCYFLLTTLRGSIVGLEPQFDMLWRRGIVTLAGLAITMVLWLLLRLFDARPLWMKVGAALILALPAAVLVAQVNQAAFWSVQDKITERMGKERGVGIRRDESGNIFIEVPQNRDAADSIDEELPAQEVLIATAPTGWDSWKAIVDIAIGRYFLLLAWSSLYFALLAIAQVKVAERRESEFRRLAKEAELRSLRYQVNPHFLFNSLNSLSALVMTGKADRAEEMIQTLSSFYRHSLADDTTSDVDLADEFALQQHYLEIESIRFPERLIIEIDLPDDLQDARIPGMILQPLIENSVKYAVAPLTRPVRIRVAAREDYGRLALTVSDDGPGSKDIAEPGFGIGLANVRDRLRARFGNEATITAGPTETGYSTEIRVPLRKHD
ncbi:sensor histidine kinase [Pontixanthobacter aquaemixtae]|uniref:Sensor histidine kinase n=1 Tax=Pontixanthobacter aquaemixtae TaxID=1958940 RepID=A0A844ZSZ6_9SPHN|nr:histidine kinase [Pontixanthobacter aquaemixtae]MXO91441.1 sensor histidine kinase [Pontixanthobacter aquaemixtae]